MARPRSRTIGQTSNNEQLTRCLLILSEHASGNLPKQQALVALRLLRPDVGASTLLAYLRKARSLR